MSLLLISLQICIHNCLATLIYLLSFTHTSLATLIYFFPLHSHDQYCSYSCLFAFLNTHMSSCSYLFTFLYTPMPSYSYLLLSFTLTGLATLTSYFPLHYHAQQLLSIYFSLHSRVQLLVSLNFLYTPMSSYSYVSIYFYLRSHT